MSKDVGQKVASPQIEECHQALGNQHEERGARERHEECETRRGTDRAGRRAPYDRDTGLLCRAPTGVQRLPKQMSQRPLRSTWGLLQTPDGTGDHPRPIDGDQQLPFDLAQH